MWRPFVAIKWRRLTSLTNLMSCTRYRRWSCRMEQIHSLLVKQWSSLSNARVKTADYLTKRQTTRFAKWGTRLVTDINWKVTNWQSSSPQILVINPQHVILDPGWLSEASKIARVKFFGRTLLQKPSNRWRFLTCFSTQGSQRGLIIYSSSLVQDFLKIKEKFFPQFKAKYYQPKDEPYCIQRDWAQVCNWVSRSQK